MPEVLDEFCRKICFCGGTKFDDMFVKMPYFEPNDNDTNFKAVLNSFYPRGLTAHDLRRYHISCSVTDLINSEKRRLSKHKVKCKPLAVFRGRF